MKIVRFLHSAGQPRLGRLIGPDRVELLRGDDLFGDLQPAGDTLPLGDLLAPVSPTNILCIGLNYRAHAAETGAPIPDRPVLFMKPTTTLNHPGGPIPLPRGVSDEPEVDFEAELAVLIGKRCKNLPPERALEAVLGYSCANDVSARRWQKHGAGGQWVRGKSFDGFCPLGPVLVTANEIPDPQSLEVECYLNGERMQHGNTADMIFPVAELVSRLSQDTTLLPGTLILTGTPPGVGFARRPPVFLAPGDRVRVCIQSIGCLENPVTAGGYDSEG